MTRNAARTTAIIADDEPRLAAFLAERLALAWPGLVIAGVAANGVEARALIDREAPDIAFLDIRMPGLTGLDVARHAGAGVHVVFVTAHDEYALQAFDHAAIDYLLKPVTDERLRETVARLKARIAAAAPPPAGLDGVLAALAQHLPQLAPATAGGERLAWVRAAAGDNVRLIAVEDVCYFQANDKYTSVFTADGEALIRTPLKDIMEQLDPQRFWQVHRGTIVNVAHVETTTRDLAGRIALSLRRRPEKVAVSRAYAHLFKQMWRRSRTLRAKSLHSGAWLIRTRTRTAPATTTPATTMARMRTRRPMARPTITLRTRPAPVPAH